MVKGGNGALDQPWLQRLHDLGPGTSAVRLFLHVEARRDHKVLCFFTAKMQVCWQVGGGRNSKV
jgi:hypothetical protein